jgi:hypothetical protein
MDSVDYLASRMLTPLFGIDIALATFPDRKSPTPVETCGRRFRLGHQTRVQRKTKARAELCSIGEE